jgi:hypothetical protein
MTLQFTTMNPNVVLLRAQLKNEGALFGHSESVSPAAAARDSSTRSSASETFVPTDFVRSARFTRHLRRSVSKAPHLFFQGPAFAFQGIDARRPHGKRAAPANRQAGC